MRILPAAAAIAFALAATALLLDRRGAAAAPAPQEGGPPATTPEHRLLERYAGTWDGEVEVSMEPGAAPSTSRSVATIRLACGGLWLLTDYEGSFAGGSFTGHEVLGFDSAKKRYVVNWVDSMSTAFSLGEATFDAATKTLTAVMQGPGPDGQPASHRQVDQWKDDDTRDWRMLSRAPDGNDVVVVRILYRRRK